MPVVACTNGKCFESSEVLPRATIECSGGKCHESSEIIARATIECSGGKCHESAEIVPRATIECSGGHCHESSDLNRRATIDCVGGLCHESSNILPRASIECSGGKCHESSEIIPRATIDCTDGKCHESSDIIPRASIDCVNGHCHESADIISRATIDCSNGKCHESSELVPRATIQCSGSHCFESQIVARSDGSNNSTTFSPTTMNLLIALVVLLFFGLCLVSTLFCLRAHRRKQRQQAADMPFQASPRPASRFSTHTILTIATGPFARPSENAALNEKEILIDEETFESPMEKPVPEIHVTFPEEMDDGGKRTSGRVVKVSISETGGVGLEPCNDEHLPPYQKSDSGKFQSLDLERIGGLKELEKSKN